MVFLCRAQNRDVGGQVPFVVVVVVDVDYCAQSTGCTDLDDHHVCQREVDLSPRVSTDLRVYQCYRSGFVTVGVLAGWVYYPPMRTGSGVSKRV